LQNFSGDGIFAGGGISQPHLGTVGKEMPISRIVVVVPNATVVLLD
jgi:hypothetical protein